jgi:uncharacterized protein YdcH (DUF465 family)
MVIQSRGMFEQLFKRKLSLDDTIYVSAKLITSVYEKIQKLNALEKIKIKESEDGSLRIEGIDVAVSEILPDLIKEFSEIDSKLAEKEKNPQLAASEQSEET